MKNNRSRLVVVLSAALLASPALIFGAAKAPPGAVAIPVGPPVVLQDKKLGVVVETKGEMLKFPLGPYADKDSVGFGFGAKIDYTGGAKNVKLTQTEWSLSYISYNKPKSPMAGLIAKRDWWRLNGRFYDSFDAVKDDLKKFEEKKLKLTDMHDDRSDQWNKLLQGTLTAGNAKLVTDNSFEYVDLPGFPGKWIPTSKAPAGIANSYKVYAMFKVEAKTTDGSNLDSAKMFGYWAEFASDGETWKLTKGQVWSFDAKDGKFKEVERTLP